MSNQNQGLNERLARKKRIQRMKTGLVWFLLIWMLASMMISVMLILKVNSLQKQIDIITKNTIRTQQVIQQENQSGGQEDALRYDTLKEADAEEQGRTESDDASIKAEGTAVKLQPDAEGRTNKNRKKVYLTFDDGPSRNTKKILAILDKYQVKASFFVTGREDEASLKWYKEIADKGHTIGMHSYSHKYDEVYASLEAFQQDFYKIQEKIQEAAGIKCTLYRFPGGSSNQVSSMPVRECIRFLNGQGIRYFDWNAECGDASSEKFTADEMAANVMKDALKYNTSVVLLHDADNKGNTVKALPQIIERLQAAGAQILPIDENTAAVQHVPADSAEE